MGLRTALETVMNGWASTCTEQYKKHPLASYIRTDSVREVEKALINRNGLTVEGSAGRGRWAAVPWLAVFDNVVTDSATHGYYVVYLFHAKGAAVHLSVNQGATATRAEFKKAAEEVLRERAAIARHRLADFSERLPITAIDLGSTAELPADYAAGHAMGVTYPAGALPTDEILAQDLNVAVAAYRALTFRGGVDQSPDTDDEDISANSAASLIELRRYRMHRRIERNYRAAKAAKKHHGTRCQACDLSFAERYGELGSGFIEAHHMRPIASLEEGAAVSYDIAKDFAVLCSNCHRMIHRTNNPADLEGFRKLLLK